MHTHVRVHAPVPDTGFQVPSRHLPLPTTSSPPPPASPPPHLQWHSGSGASCARPRLAACMLALQVLQVGVVNLEAESEAEIKACT